MTKETTKAEEITLLYGIAEKSYFDMNAEERKEVAVKALERAREAAFSRGLPIICDLTNKLLRYKFSDDDGNPYFQKFNQL